MTETQKMFEKFTAGHRRATEGIEEMSMELMSAPMRDEEKERLENLRAELDSDRQRFTESAITFGHERAVLEVNILRPSVSRVLFFVS